VSDFLWLAGAAHGDGWIGRWSPGIGDPTAAGWLATLAYFATAWCCRAAALRIRPAYRVTPAVRREWRLWRALAPLLAVLGINKQLDLQSAITELARMLARSGGWYDERRGVQLAFVAAVAATALAASLAALWATRRTSPPARIAVFGTAALLGFIAARAASFHRIDVAISTELLGLRLSSLVELAGIALIFAATRWQQRIYGARAG
jgi:hypothetical protein